MRVLLVLSLLVVSATCRAEANCGFSLSRKVSNNAFAIRFKSVTNDCNNDDMEATFTAGSQSKKVSIAQSWYYFTPHIAKDLDPVCKDKAGVQLFSAYKVANSKVLFFIKRSGRPGCDNLVVFLLNPKSRAILDALTLGPSRNVFVPVLPDKNAFKTRVIRDSMSFHNEVTCDCDASFVDDWMVVEVINDKIKNHG